MCQKPIMEAECCATEAEIIDDTLKTLWQADGAMSSGDEVGRLKALAYVNAQRTQRVPHFAFRTLLACGQARKSYVFNKAEEMKEDLKRLETLIQSSGPHEVHEAIYALDHKYAIPAYEAYCACRGRKE